MEALFLLLDGALGWPLFLRTTGRLLGPSLLQDAGAVTFDRPRTQMHAAGDLLVGQAGGKVLEHVDFARSQRLAAGQPALRARIGPREFIDGSVDPTFQAVTYTDSDLGYALPNPRVIILSDGRVLLTGKGRVNGGASAAFVILAAWAFWVPQ